jgi:hypothetical protein
VSTMTAGQGGAGQGALDDLWRTVKVISGVLPSARPNPILRDRRSEHITPQRNAEALAGHYEYECTLSAPAPEHVALERRLAERLQVGVRSGPTAPLTMGKLHTALRATKPGKAAGPDDIPVDFPRGMGPVAQRYMLATRAEAGRCRPSS